MSKRYTLSKPDIGKILKVVFYAGGSGVLVALLSILPDVEFSVMFAWTVPVVNILLVAAVKFFKSKQEVNEG